MRITRTAQKQANEPLRRLFASEEMNLADVARVMHVSRERIRQIENGALAKLATALHERGLTLEDLIGDQRGE
ncbi:sigma factor-like helix-turn-helix DNA-binding protein [Variovorax sp. J22P240]|uniref:sigma factor-like helix-turn-helix DNA-binding protein n=1 Tax=Variovorax sp. J22P240 TaxID=3053514 RepID=UPI0025788315|nr:sigma factor-like helix-turn-helix DNA-binding protein [Variovorax sp. J22P240]MDL9997249.1 sigma factor-like helix-turn-helix DNA-binding protein [Variovorax sp. J22P240]